VDELRDLLDADLLAKMRGDAEHLLGIVRAVAATPQPKLLERSPSVRTAHVSRRFSEQRLFFGGPAFANRPKMVETFKRGGGGTFNPSEGFFNERV